ncbi:unnamed protein product [Adineta steineri]|uniref:Uncharacterized protein n=1 Tax=Adineta steineri TaxID=433720 RepID=A0A814WHV6_9BILA|nr:unnamed protein product [Adineta steineri]
MFVFRASSIDERNRIIQCLFTRAKHCSNQQCNMDNKHRKNNLDEPERKTKSSVESSSPNPLRSSIEEDDEEDERSIPPPPEFGQDDDSCPVPCSSSSSSSLSDGDLLDNDLGGTGSTSTTTTTMTGQFLWIDHQPRRHSIANDSFSILAYALCYTLKVYNYLVDIVIQGSNKILSSTITIVNHSFVSFIIFILM